MNKDFLKFLLLFAFLLTAPSFQAQILNKKGIEKRIENLNLVPKKQFHDTILVLCNELRFYDREYARANVKKLANISEGINAKSQVFALIYYAKLSDQGQIAIVDQAYKIAEHNDIKEYLGLALVTKSELHKLMGDYDLAMESILQARDFDKKTNNTIELVTVLHMIGDLYFAAEDFAKAEEIYKQVLKVKGDLNDWGEWRESVIRNNLGLIAMKLGFYDSAINHFNYSLQLKNGRDFKTRDDTIRNVYIYSQLSEVYRLQNNPTKSLDYFDIAIAPALKYKQFDFLGELYFTKSLILKQQMKFDDALQYAQLSDSISKKGYTSLAFRLKLMRLFAELYENNGNDKKALYFQKSAGIINDSLNYKLTKSRYMQLLAQNNYDNIAYKLKYKEKVNIFLIIFSLLVLTSMAYFLFLNKRLKGAFLKLVQKNMEVARQTPIPIESKNLEFSNETDKNELNDPLLEQLIQHFEKYLQINEWFLQHDFTLQKAADLLETNRTYLSKAINNILGMSFNSYINVLRIKYAINLIQLGISDSLTIESISEKVGFNSRSVFISAFRNYTGVTPSFFIKNHNSESKNEIV